MVNRINKYFHKKVEKDLEMIAKIETILRKPTIMINGCRVDPYFKPRENQPKVTQEDIDQILEVYQNNNYHITSLEDDCYAIIPKGTVNENDMGYLTLIFERKEGKLEVSVGHKHTSDLKFDKERKIFNYITERLKLDKKNIIMY